MHTVYKGPASATLMLQIRWCLSSRGTAPHAKRKQYTYPTKAPYSGAKPKVDAQPEARPALVPSLHLHAPRIQPNNANETTETTLKPTKVVISPPHINEAPQSAKAHGISSCVAQLSHNSPLYHTGLAVSNVNWTAAEPKHRDAIRAPRTHPLQTINCQPSVQATAVQMDKDITGLLEHQCPLAFQNGVKRKRTHEAGVQQDNSTPSSIDTVPISATEQLTKLMNGCDAHTALLDAASAACSVKLEFEKPKRSKLSDDQLAVLLQEFEENPFPTFVRRQTLATRLGVAPRSLHIWFQNRRQRLKAQETPSACPVQIALTSRATPVSDTQAPNDVGDGLLLLLACAARPGMRH